MNPNREPLDPEARGGGDRGPCTQAQASTCGAYLASTACLASTREIVTARNADRQVRYIDPSYQVRSVPANTSDAIYCSDLGSAAVHGAMAGFTGFRCVQPYPKPYPLPPTA